MLKYWNYGRLWKLCDLSIGMVAKKLNQSSSGLGFVGLIFILIQQGFIFNYILIKWCQLLAFVL